MPEVVAAIEAAAPEAAGKITYEESPLPFPEELEARALEQAIGPLPQPSLAEGIARDDRAVPPAALTTPDCRGIRRDASHSAPSTEGRPRWRSSLCLLVSAALVVVLNAGAATQVAEAPPGAVISDSLEYVARVPDSAGIVEGKFDTVGKREILVTTGRFGFKTYDVSDPESPQLLDTFQPADILGANGYWQDEDMDLDVRRNLIIGALDPRHDDVDQTACPGTGTTRNPACRSGFYVISYEDPANLRQVGDFVELPAGHTSSCIENCHYVWTGGPARRNDQADLGAFHPGRPRRRTPDLGHGSHRPRQSSCVPRADRPVAERRSHRLLA